MRTGLGNRLLTCAPRTDGVSLTAKRTVTVRARRLRRGFNNTLLVLALLAVLPAFGDAGSALIDAARSDDQNAVGTLLRQGANVNAQDEDGATPLAWAAEHSNLPLTELLLSKGANADITNHLGIGPLS